MNGYACPGCDTGVVRRHTTRTNGFRRNAAEQAELARVEEINLRKRAEEELQTEKMRVIEEKRKEQHRIELAEVTARRQREQAAKQAEQEKRVAAKRANDQKAAEQLGGVVR